MKGQYMIDFKPITLEDKQWIQPLLNYSDYNSTEYSFTFSYLWREIFGYQVARINDYFILKAVREGYPCSYLFPAGKGDIKPVLDALIEDSQNCGAGLVFHTVLEDSKEILDSHFPGEFEYLEQTDFFDYVYLSENLINLTGKKFSGKRNHINRFKDNNPNWSFEEITSDNLDEVINMNEKWKNAHIDQEDNRQFSREMDSVDMAIHDFEKLGLKGGLIRADGEVVAFSMGDPVSSDTYLIHIEKAFAHVQGAYPIINQEFARHFCSDYKYINREDAAGNPGLIRAKESYRPIYLLKKYGAKRMHRK